MLNKEELKKIGAKYVLCLKEAVYVKSINSIVTVYADQYLVGWSDMSLLEEAPESVFFPFSFLSDGQIITISVKRSILHIIEKLS